MLIIFSGLPGTGKTTLAGRTARELAAVYLRIDSLEMGLVRSGLVSDQWDLGPAGYCAAQAVARDNLRNGMTVVADSVNPLQITRDAWRDVAARDNIPYLEIELLCSDGEEHKRRVENRRSDINAHRPPTWQEVMERRFDPWDRERLVLDTATLAIDEAVAAIIKQVLLKVSLSGSTA